MQKELHKQGADTERLQDIARQLQDIEQELLFIKDHATLLIEYQKDKRDLINHIPEWKREYEEQKRLLDNEKENVRKEINSLQGEIDKLSKSVNEAIWKPMKESLSTNGTSLIRIFSDWKSVPIPDSPYRKVAWS